MAQFVSRLEATFTGQAQTHAWQVFRARLEEHFGALLGSLLRLYGQRDDFSDQLDAVLTDGGADVAGATRVAQGAG